MPLYAGASFGLSFAAFLKSLSDFSYSPRAFAVAFSASLPFLVAASSSSFLPFMRWSSPLLYASIARSSGDIDGSPDDPPPDGAGADEPFAKIPTCASATATAINTDILNIRTILLLLVRFQLPSSSCREPRTANREPRTANREPRTAKGLIHSSSVQDRARWKPGRRPRLRPLRACCCRQY